MDSDENQLDLTQVLQAAESGDSSARARVVQVAYDDLRKIAVARMAGERQNHTLSSTALVHEVSMKLLQDNQLAVGGRRQFFAYASKAMRNFLIDHARRRGRQKRGGDATTFSLDEAWVAAEEQCDELMALDEALQQLADVEPRKAKVVEMRYFGGLNNNEVASALEVSLATVKRDWEVAKMWLLNKMKQGGDES